MAASKYKRQLHPFTSTPAEQMKDELTDEFGGNVKEGHEGASPNQGGSPVAGHRRRGSIMSVS